MGDIRLLSLLNEVLNEVGDLRHVESSPFEKITDSLYVFWANINGEEINAEVRFQPLSKHITADELEVTSRIFKNNFNGDLSTIFNVGYKIGGKTSQYQRSNIKDFYVTMKTVVEIIKDFIKTNQPFGIVFFEEDKLGGIVIDKQKRIFNHAISSNNLPPNYRMEEGKIGEIEMTIIYKNKIK